MNPRSLMYSGVIRFDSLFHDQSELWFSESLKVKFPCYSIFHFSIPFTFSWVSYILFFQVTYSLTMTFLSVPLVFVCIASCRGGLGVDNEKLNRLVQGAEEVKQTEEFKDCENTIKDDEWQCIVELAKATRVEDSQRALGVFALVAGSHPSQTLQELLQDLDAFKEKAGEVLEEDQVNKLLSAIRLVTDPAINDDR